MKRIVLPAIAFLLAISLLVPPAGVAAEGGHADPYAIVFEGMAVVLVAASVGRWAARCLKQSPVLGELAAGILAGALLYHAGNPAVVLLRHADILKQAEATAMAELLTTMPGVGELVAQVIVGEIGTDMRRFPSAAHLVSWAGLCPRSDESAGKRRNTRIRHGAPWLKTTLVQAAWSAVAKKNSYHRAQFQRLKSRRGPKKAIIAVAEQAGLRLHKLETFLPFHFFLIVVK